MGLITGASIKGKENYVQHAQPSVNIPSEALNLTYTAGFISVTVAASATDVFTIENPVAGVNVKVTHMGLGGTQTTAGQISIQLIKRSTLNTLGGGAMTTAGAVPMDSLDPFVAPATTTANAIVRAYTANPGALGAQIGSVVRADRFFVPAPATTVAGDSSIILGEFGFQPAKNVCLRQNELLAVNFNAATVTGGVFAFWVWWTEEIDRGAVYAEG